MLPSESVDEKIVGTEKDFAFGSLARYSGARIDERVLRKSGRKHYKTSGELILKSFSEIPDVIENCTRQFLTDLPSSIRLICFLGVTDQYIQKCRNLMKKIYPPDFEDINDVAYAAQHFLCGHLTHPSRGNGTKEAWLESDPDDPNTSCRNAVSARKRELSLVANQPLAGLR